MSRATVIIIPHPHPQLPNRPHHRTTAGARGRVPPPPPRGRARRARHPRHVLSALGLQAPLPRRCGPGLGRRQKGRRRRQQRCRQATIDGDEQRRLPLPFPGRGRGLPGAGSVRGGGVAAAPGDQGQGAVEEIVLLFVMGLSLDPDASIHPRTSAHNSWASPP